MTNSLRRWTATAFAAIAACSTVLVGPGVASAEDGAGSINCVGTTQVTYDPGITLAPRTVQATETNHLSPCTSTEEGITAGMNVLEYEATWSCLTPLEAGTANYAFHWNNGTSSTLSIDYTITSVGGQAVFVVHGSVTEGVLSGATVSGTWTFAQPNILECLSPQGMTKQIGTITLNITRV